MKFAFDKSTMRRIDADGRMHVEMSHISKACVNPYYGQEIPGWQELGLDPDKVYNLYRDPDELAKAAPTFERLPILIKHVPFIVGDDEVKDLIVGAIGSNVSFNAPYLDADICFWDEKAIAGIETEAQRELSCSYRYIPVMEPGEVDGERYDGKMTQIQGNHLALVEVGRAGPDVVVSDHLPPEGEIMKKALKLRLAAIGMASQKLAADSAIKGMLSKKLNKDEFKTRALAVDAELNPQQLDNLIDALIGVEDESENNPDPVVKAGAVGDESPEEQIRAMLAGKVDDDIISKIVAMCTATGDEGGGGMAGATPAAGGGSDEEEDKMSKKDVDKAMDELRKQLREAAQAAREVRETVGDVAMDSAEEIYSFALKHLGIAHDGVTGVTALRTLYNVASKKESSPVKVAVDSASAMAKVPGLARISQA